MKKVISVVIVALLLLQVFSFTAFASGSQPVGGCPSGFELMNYMTPPPDMQDMHIGLSDDLNGDEYICMYMATPDLHVHVDNTVPLN